MNKRNIIVIGASAGGFDVLKRLVADLPANLEASVFIVWHISPDVRGVLPQVLNKLETLHAAHAVDNEPIKNGRIYVAPPDHHMLIEEGRVRITKGPKENRFRPAVDPLFRSAAYTYGRRVIGVILSGALDDGSAGLCTIKEHGGIAVVQDPADAEVPSMPENALRAVNADYKVPVAEMASLLESISNTFVEENIVADMKENGKTKGEIDVALEENSLKEYLKDYSKLTPYTCPECHGVLSAIKEGSIMRFRCHTGHAYSADSLLASITENIEDSLWVAIRTVQESIMLLNNLGDHFSEINKPKVAAMYFQKAKDAEQRAAIVKEVVMQHQVLSINSILQEAHETSDEVHVALEEK